MAKVMAVIQELVREAMEALAMRGFDQPYMLDGLTEDGAIIGCRVIQKNADGERAWEDVYYPENWRKRYEAGA
jgi:hypothetical protein